MRLTTDRLTLRPYEAADAPHVLAIRSRHDVMRWLGDGEPVLMADLDEARAWCVRQRDLAPPYEVWAIVPREVGHVVGSVMLVPIPGTELVQIGWHLHPDHAGRGYASEAAIAVLDHGLTTLGLTEIRALTHLDNHASVALALRIGMRDLGVTEEWCGTPSRLFLAEPPAGRGAQKLAR